MFLKKLLKEIIPPMLLSFLKKKNWSGDYRHFETALAKSKGYDCDSVLKKVIEAAEKVKSGEFPYERDSVLFSKIEYSYGLLSALSLILLHEKKLSVLDFGGSLGSSYFQNKILLKYSQDISWSIVEQKHFVKVGTEKFADSFLSFYESVDECLRITKINTLIISSVLQYLPEPIDFIKEILNHKFPYIIIDRTGFSLDSKNRLTLQNVPKEIYEASYPCWFFSEKDFVSLFESEYELVFDWDALDKADIPSYYKGYFFKRK